MDRPDISWARGSLSDNLNVGDVIHVRAVTSDADGSFQRWSLRQVPEIQGGFMAMDVNNGRVIAMQGGFSYEASVFNRATQAQRQPGSAFKPFVYAAALDSGFTPATIVIDAPIEIATPQGVWRPTNASNRFYGPTPVRTGIERSRNLMTVRLAQEVGMDVVGGYAERFGVYDTAQTYLANALGSQETTLFQMVAAYAMFANGGERVEPTLVDRVQDRYGRTIYRHDQRNCVDCDERGLARAQALDHLDRARVMDEVTAYQLTSMMQGVVQRVAQRHAPSTCPCQRRARPAPPMTRAMSGSWATRRTSSQAAIWGMISPSRWGAGQGAVACAAPCSTNSCSTRCKKYGGGRFRVPDGGYFLKIDRTTGARLPDDASGPNVVAEFFREGEEPIFGLGAIIDGGFAMGGDLPMFAPGEAIRSRWSARTPDAARRRPPALAPSPRVGCISGRTLALSRRSGKLCTGSTRFFEDGPSQCALKRLA